MPGTGRRPWYILWRNLDRRSIFRWLRVLLKILLLKIRSNRCLEPSKPVLHLGLSRHFSFSKLSDFFFKTNSLLLLLHSKKIFRLFWPLLLRAMLQPFSLEFLFALSRDWHGPKPSLQLLDSLRSFYRALHNNFWQVSEKCK